MHQIVTLSYLCCLRASRQYSVASPAPTSPLSSWASCASSSCTGSKTSTSASKRNCPFPFLERLLWSSCQPASRTAWPYRATTRWTWLGRYQQGRLLRSHFVSYITFFRFFYWTHYKCYLMCLLGFSLRLPQSSPCYPIWSQTPLL